MSSENRGKPDPKPDPADTPVIHIDNIKREAPKPIMTGAELRALGPVADNRTLWQEVPGGEDLPIDATASVELRNGMHFYSVAVTVGEG